MNWLFFVIAGAFLHACGNITEKITVSRYVNHKNRYSYMVIFFLCSAIVALIFLPFADLAQISSKVYLFLALRVLIAIIGTYFWVKLMMNEEVSRIIGFMFSYILVAFVLDFLIFSTKLSLFGYFGGIVLFSSAILMTYKPTKRMFLHKSNIIYLIIMIFVWGIWAIVIKSLTYYVNTATYLFIDNLTLFLTGIVILAASSNLRQNVKKFFHISKLFWANIFLLEGFYTLGLLTSFRAYSLQKVSVVVPFETIQPTFVFFIALFLSHYFPKYIKEEIDKKTISYKIVSLILLTVGVYFMIKYGAE
ncbi:hypothetical protein HYU06_02185 [Candidatus Woesearchaeota archaeon]|nr:hypothetical protein [Candidatus Woesearchaeota archaeon]